MKKTANYLLYIGLFLFLGFFGMNQVKAGDCNKYQCLTCVYEGINKSITYSVEANGKGGQSLAGQPTIKSLDKDSRAVYTIMGQDVAADHFRNEAQTGLKCPQSIKMKMEAGGHNTNIAIYLKPSSNNSKDGYAIVNLKTENNNNKPYMEEEASKAERTFCEYTADNIGGTIISCQLSTSTYDNSISGSCSNGYSLKVLDDVNISQFAGGTCPKLHFHCGGDGSVKVCSVSKNNIVDEQRGDDGSEGKKTDTADDIDKKNQTVKPDIEFGPLSCESLEELTKFAGKIYGWVEIFLLIGLVILTMMDYTKAITLSDDDRMKKANKHLVTRIIIFFIALLLPTLIGMILQVFVPNITTCIGFK